MNAPFRGDLPAPSIVRDSAEVQGGNVVNEDVHLAAGPTYEQMAHRGRTTASKVYRVVPLVLALLMVGLLAYAVVLPFTAHWQEGPGAVLLQP